MRRSQMIISMLAVYAIAVPLLVAGTPQNKPTIKPKKPQSKDRTMQTLLLLGKEIEAVAFNEAPFEEVLDWFRKQGLKNIVVHWRRMAMESDIHQGTEVSLQLSELTLGQALDWVLEQVSDHAYAPQERLTYHIREGVIEISTREYFGNRLFVRAYNVEDLLLPLIFYQDPPKIDVTKEGSGGGNAPGGGGGSPGNEGGGTIFEPGDGEEIDFRQLRDIEISKLIQLITQIESQTWRNQGGNGTIKEFQGKLIVSQTLEMHEILGGTQRKVR